MRLRLSLQSWIFFASILVVILTLVFVSAIINGSLRNQLISQEISSLVRETKLVEEIISDRWPIQSRDTFPDNLISEFHNKFNLQTTIITSEHEILSDLPLPETKPSITLTDKQQSLNGDISWGIRRDEDRDNKIIETAVYLDRPSQSAPILLLSRPLSNLPVALSRVGNYMIWASIFGVLLSLAVSFIVAQRIFHPVRELTRTALDISSGDLSQRLRSYPNHEVGDLGRAFDRMADHLQAQIEEMTRSRDRLEAILRGMVEGVLVTDEHGRISLANRALLKLLDLKGYPIGRKPAEILRNPCLIETIQQVIAGTPYASIEIRTLGRRSRTIEAEVAALPGEGHRAGAVAVFHDITERKRIEEMRRDFVANVSHELRTPLAAIRASVETRLTGALDNPKYNRKFTQTIDRQVKRLEALVLDLLELAKLESGHERPKTDRIDLGAVARSSVAAVNDLAKARQIELIIETPDDEVPITGNSRQLEQAVINLLENAIKYSDSSGRITLKLVDENGELHLGVTDMGIGIAPEYHDRIFERFYRVDKNRSREIGGTGLGLAIVKHVAQAHGGRVEITSFPGKGSTFTLIFPKKDD